MTTPWERRWGFHAGRKPNPKGGGGKGGGRGPGRGRGRGRGGGGVSDPFAGSVVLLVNFDGTAGGTDAVDEGPLSLTLSYQGNAVLGTTRTYNANYGTSLNLDGSGDFIRILNAPSFFNPGNGAWTVEVRYYSTHPGGNQDHVFGTGDETTNSSRSFQLTIDDNTSGTITYNDQRSNAQANRINLTSQTDFRNQWHEYAIGFDGTTIRMWKDGTIIGSNSPANKTLDIDAGNLIIGGQGFVPGTDSFQGQIQAFRLTTASRYGSSNYTVDPAKWTL